MIISRTPFRISFFGGGTDYPVWYHEHGGAVLTTSINKHCYISCRYLPPFFEHKSRIVWSKVETVRHVSDIEHPAVRETLKFLDVTQGVELHYDGDLPARTGLGSSSAFTVGLLHTLYGLKGIMPSKLQLARDAIYVEQELLKEYVGCQDQVIAAFGGFNRIDFFNHGEFLITPVILNEARLSALQDHLMLFFTGFSRNASEIAAAQTRATKDKVKELQRIQQMVDQAITILQQDSDVVEFGELLHEAWQVKRTLTDKVSTPQIDAMYEAARQAGAIGGKLLGAGGGGFLLLFVRPEEQDKVKDALNGLLHVPFRFEAGGSRVIFYDPDTMDDSGVLSGSVDKALPKVSA